MEIVISLLLSIPLGVVSGVYSGFIVYRYSRFEELRTRAKQIIHGIDFVSSNNEPVEVIFNKDADKRELFSIANEFFYLKHQKAGSQIMEIFNALGDVLLKEESKKLGYSEMNESYLQWQKICRTIKPNLKQILFISRS